MAANELEPTTPIEARDLPRCGNCKYCHLVPTSAVVHVGAPKQHICRAWGPTSVAIPSPQGVLIRTQWPVVLEDEDDCYHYKRRRVDA